MRVCLKLLVLVLCKSVFTQYECNWCSCCKNGRSRCSVQNGLCHDGCIPGFYDPQCRHRCAEGCVICSDKFSCRQCQSNSYSCAVCPTNCLSCDFANRCISCKDGFYNVQHQSGNQNQYSDCSHPCRSTCASCVSLDTCTACVDGKYGIAEYVPNHGTVQDCRFDCKPSCKTCRTFDRCTLCIDGKYKGRYRDDKYSNWYNDCRYYCKPNCKSCTSYSHCSSCIEGKYSGKYTDEPYAQWYGDCRYSCSSTCKSCVSFNQCTSCINGKYSGRLNDSFLNAEYNDCRHNCKSSCRSCTSFFKCSECVPGKYGVYCESMCGRGCFNSTCDKKTGTCTCLSGFRGNDCNFCANGRFGIDCDNICKGCLNNHCQRDGKCIIGCKPGFREVKCDSCEPGKYGEYCNSSCDSKCEQCVSKTNCTACKKGYFGEHCQSRCPSHCKICISGNACFECNGGFFGKMCSDECPRNCKNNLCIKENGTCFSCNLGFYGSHCVSKCPLNCANETCDINGNCNACKGNFANIARKCECTTQICLDKSCSRCNDSTYYVEKGACCECSKTCKNAQCESAFKCLSGCENGYHGDDCSLTCKDIEPLCAECSTNFSTTSEVCLKCDVGYYPNEASNLCVTCPQNCANTVCDQTNGMCTQGCTDGRWDEKCNRNCSLDCHQCQQSTGKCLTCNDGKFLSNCTEKCSENCNFTREGVGICSLESGACQYGCSSFSKYGTYCENDCNDNCVSHVCDWNTGYCLSGCNPGFYGKNCENLCGKMCLKVEIGRGQCNESNGYCFGGCTKGWYGALCDQKCGVACINKTCDRESGNCFYGCSGGYKGPKCLQALKGSHDDGSKTGLTLGLAAGIVSVVLVIFGIITVCYIRKRRNKAKGKENIIDENRGGSSAIAFSELQSREREIEQNDAVYARPSKPKKREAEESVSTMNTISNVAAAHVTSCKQEQNDAVYAMPNKLKKREVSMDTDKTITDAISVTCSETKSNNNKHGTVGDQHLKETVVDIDTDSGKNNIYDEITLSVDNSSSETKPNIKPPIKAKSAVVYENTSLKSPASKHLGLKYNTRRSANSVMEIEEDLSNLTAYTRNTTQLQEDAGAYETEGDNAYYNVAAMIKRKVPLDKLAEYVSELTREDFEEEFDNLPPGLIKPYIVSQKKENLTKNRYKGIYPYDKTRVILTGGSDYINASFIDGYKGIKAYIASIGPTYKYMEDMSPFWRMVWQEKVGKIVMLTNLSEAGEPKCDQYWPRKDCSELFTDIQVTSDREEVYADYTIRSFTLQKDSEIRCIFHAHFTAWPDKGTPDDVTSLIEFRQKVNSLCTDLDGPVVVHCSAGIGRTGTYISIDSLAQEGEAEDAVDIYACVRNLREHRVNMVQTAGQYQYLHKALVHILTFDCKPVKASNFHRYMSTHTTEHLGNQFQHLQDSIKARTVDETEAVRLNKRLTEKNRQGADIPGDINRPRLHLQRQNGMAAYINALFINSFRTKKRFLIAQSPLPSTVEDFLTLIVQEHVSYIVSMEPNGNKAVGAYYPVDKKPLIVGSCTVTSEKAEYTDHYIQRTLKILHQGKSKTQEVTVNHIQFTKWNENQKTPDNPKMFLRFVRDVEIKCDSNDKERPILVHCLTGAEKSGLFCVVSILLEKIQLEQEISVVNTVRQVKNRRHMSIANKEQYIFCHKCLDEYLRTFDTYSNFSLET